jgi:hypothetical protein
MTYTECSDLGTPQAWIDFKTADEAHKAMDLFAAGGNVMQLIARPE